MKCLICGEELKTDCEKSYGICLKDAGKVKNLIAFAMSFQGFSGEK
jgi:hypothetical protein